MVDPVTGAVVDGFVGLVLGKLGSKVFEELTQIYGVESQFRKLKKTLSAINAVLQDAEEQQYNNNSIRNWLVNIKDVVYDIEDLLDLISTQDLKRKVNGKSIGRLFTGLYSRYSLTEQVKEICRRLDEVAEIQRDFNLRGYQSDHAVHNSAQQRETSSHIQESEVFGREQDRDWIVTRLVSSSTRENEQFLVLPIVGMGGIGKTTLAKLVFNDSRVKVDGKFDFRLWVYVSKKFVLKTVIGNIIQSATGKDFSNSNLETLQNILRSILEGRTFLLVLDDVWVNDRVQWLELKKLLPVGSRKSVIIVTTREESVASITGTIKFHRLQHLPEDYCWSIFVASAFKKNEEKKYPRLVEIGKSIIRKCAGSPLAVKTLGALLWTKREVDAWRKIEGSEIWKIDDEGNDILPVLKLSLDHTPYYLRSCFTYCAIFGKGYPLHRIDLINVWMAQGLLEGQNGIEDGDECFDELLSRSFFQHPGYAVIKKHVNAAATAVFEWHTYWVNLAQSFKNNTTGDVDTIRKRFSDYRGKPFLVEMHDLMQDLAAYVAGEEIASVSSCTSEISERARHLVWDEEDLSGKEFPIGLLKESKARTSAFLHPMGSLSKSFLESLLLNFKCLRVLMLLQSEFEELPDLIGDLKHLRYLDVSVNSKLKTLPNAICKLVNLQVLDFGHCSEIAKLPKDMHRLISLRSLIVTSNATCLPQCCSSLKTLKILRCPNLTSLPEGMGSLKSLRVFRVVYCSSLASLPDDMNQLTNLEELSIGHCQQLDLAQWDGLNGLRNLKCLRLNGIPKLVDFPDGLKSMAGSLQFLRIWNCEALRSLPEELELCTSLLKLQVSGCGELSKLPVGVQALVGLQELDIAKCSVLSERCEREIGDDWLLISHIPYIQIDYQVIQNRLDSTQE